MKVLISRRSAQLEKVGDRQDIDALGARADKDAAALDLVAAVDDTHGRGHGALL